MTEDRPAPLPWVVVGLGNPGKRYERNRHNVGFHCVDLLAARHGISLGDRRAHAVLGQGGLDGASVVLAKPRTYMNRSGVAAVYLAQRFGVRPSHLLVVTDDMDLPLGTLRLRAAGGSGGQNGLNSIIEELGTQDFPRLRIGIGRPLGGAVQHVLSSFSAEEDEAVREVLGRAADVVEACMADGVETAMNRFN